MEILIGKDNTCTCTCADKCIKSKTGSAPRCTKEELEELGYKTKQIQGKFNILKYFFKNK